jgi:hypothetical protein
MKRTVQPTGLFAGLRVSLRETWLQDLVNQCRTVKRLVMRRSEGEAILLQRYRRLHGKPLNLTNPQRFTEKLFWRMITWNRGQMPLRFQDLADKYAVRAHVASTVGEDYLVKLLWQGEDPRAIPFDQLPTKYVIKSNHASEQVIVVKGHADRENIVRNVATWLAVNYYWHAREYQYYGIPPRIIIEERLANEDGSPLLDYKIWCFNGMPELIQVRDYATDISSFFDTAWNQLDLSYKEGPSRPWMPKPANLEELLALAAKLSADFGFGRVDLYNVKGRVYFGEITLTPTGGNLKFSPDHWDVKLGEKWDLSMDR